MYHRQMQCRDLRRHSGLTRAPAPLSVRLFFGKWYVDHLRIRTNYARWGSSGFFAVELGPRGLQMQGISDYQDPRRGPAT